MPNDVLELTAEGRHELAARERGLSLPQRWLLVRVNGRASLAELARTSSQADAQQRLPMDAERLVQKGLVRWVLEPPDDTATVPAALDTVAAEALALGPMPMPMPMPMPVPVPVPSPGPTPALESTPLPVLPTPALRRRKAMTLPAVGTLLMIGVAGAVAVALGLPGRVEVARPLMPTVITAAPAATLPAGQAGQSGQSGPAEPARPRPVAPARSDAAQPAAAAALPATELASSSLGAAPAPVSAPTPASQPAAALAAPATVLAPITSAVPVPLSSMASLGRSADPVAGVPALAVPVLAPVPQVAPAAPATVLLQPVFSPRPGLPREWQSDTRPVVQFNANLSVDASGTVSQVTFSGASPADGPLVRASRQSLLQWRFPEGAPGRTHRVELVFRVD